MQNFHIFLLKFLFISFFKTFPYKNLPQWRDPQLGGPAWQFCQEYHLSDWTVLHSREDRRADAGVHWWWQESASYCILCTWDSSCGRGFCQQPCTALWQTQISRKIFLYNLSMSIRDVTLQEGHCGAGGGADQGMVKACCLLVKVCDLF